MAWLSTSQQDALARLADVGPWYLVDRTTLVSPNKASLVALPRASISLTEQGEPVPGSFLEEVWTATDADGRLAGDSRYDACSDWTSDGSGHALQGNAHDDEGWTSYGIGPCSESARLSCFEQERRARDRRTEGESSSVDIVRTKVYGSALGLGWRSSIGRAPDL